MTSGPMARGEIDALRRGLLRIHRALLDEERLRYEREHGRIEGTGALLQLVIHDPWFAWLHPVSELIVQLDEALEDADAVTTGAAGALLARAREHLRPDAGGTEFQRRYLRLVHDAPAVAVAHAETRRLAGG